MLKVEIYGSLGSKENELKEAILREISVYKVDFKISGPEEVVIETKDSYPDSICIVIDHSPGRGILRSFLISNVIEAVSKIFPQKKIDFHVPL